MLRKVYNTNIFTLLLLFIISISIVCAQENKFNKFSAELNLGFTLKNDTNQLNALSYFNSEFAFRYAFKPTYGIKLDFGFNDLKRDMDPFASLTKTYLFRYSLQLVANIGRMVKIERFAPRISLLVHVGGGLTSQRYDISRAFRSWKNNNADERINLMIGLTPQFKISPRFETHLDVTYIGNLYQDFNKGFDWGDLSKSSKMGTIFNVNIGATYYIGKQKEHADWYFNEKPIFIPEKNPLKSDTNAIVIVDTDLDGIEDASDSCPSLKGIAENHGCPVKNEVIECTLDENPIITFEYSKTTVSEKYRLILIKYADCLKKEPFQKIVIHGCSDNIGDQIAIDDLSFRRALNVKKILTEQGIDKDRLVITTDGAKKALIPQERYQEIKHNRVVWFENIANNFYDVRTLEENYYPEGLFYTVQIGSFEKNIDFKAFEKYGKVLITPSRDKSTKVSLGVYLTLQEAQEKLLEIRQTGKFPDSFVTSYYLGDRITITQSKLLYGEKGASILEKSK